MRKEIRLHKIRIIAKTYSGDVLGVSLPPSLHHWINISVNIRESGNCLILESGCTPIPLTKTMINNNSTNLERIKI